MDGITQPVLDALGVAVALYVVEDSGRIRYHTVNRAMAALLGRAPAAGEALATVLPPDELAQVLPYFQAALAQLEAVAVTRAGERGWWKTTLTPLLDGRGQATGLVETRLDVTDQQASQSAVEAHVHSMERYSAVLLDLVRFLGRDEARTLDTSLRYITEQVGRALQVERASIWRFDKTFAELECLDLYVQSRQQHTGGQHLTAYEFPTYFNALRQDRALAASEAHTDPRTFELSAGYLRQHGITAMLDAPLHAGGELIGVVCHEHVGLPRTWTPEETIFAASVGEIVSLVLEGHERRRVEMALRLSEEKFSLAFRSSPDIITISRFDDGRYIEVNDSFVQLSGYRREEALGKTSIELNLWVNPEDRARMTQQLQEKGRIRNLEVAFHTRHDGIRDMLISSEEVILHGERCIVSVVRDITERKLAREALRLSQEKFAMLFNASPVAMTLTAWPEGRFLDVNEAFLQATGYTQADVLGRTTQDLGLWVDATERDALLGALQERGHTREHAARFRARSGEVRHLVVSGQRLHLHGQACLLMAGRDVTDYHRAEAAAQASERRFTQVFQANPSAITLTRLRDGCILDVNEAFTRFTGYTRDEVVGHSTPHLNLWANPSDRDAYAQALAQDQQVRNQLFSFRIKSGEIRRAIVSATIIEVDGEPCIAGIAYDVTAQFQAQEEIHRLNAELERRVQQRTAALEATNRELEAFSYAVSHDLRAPLRAIEGFSQMLLRRPEGHLQAEDRRYLDLIGQAARQTDAIIRALLALSLISRTELRKTAVSLSHLATDILHTLQQTHPDRQVTWEVEPNLVGQGDEQLLRRVLDNLLGNAWKYTARCEEARITVGSAIHDGARVFFIRDNGVGFDMKYVGRLFTAFQRLHADTEFEGTGVGLATVQRILQRHGGRIWAEGAVDQGATFWFTLE